MEASEPLVVKAYRACQERLASVHASFGAPRSMTEMQVALRRAFIGFDMDIADFQAWLLACLRHLDMAGAIDVKDEDQTEAVGQELFEAFLAGALYERLRQESENRSGN